MPFYSGDRAQANAPSTVTVSGEKPATNFPSVVSQTAAPKVAAPSVIAGDGGVARMTFTTGSKVASGFVPQKDDPQVQNNGAVETVRKDLSDQLAVGDKQNGDASVEVMSTPKRGRLEGGEDSVVSTPKSTVK